MSIQFHEKSLEYHRQGKPGKIQVSSHKSLNTWQDLFKSSLHARCCGTSQRNRKKSGYGKKIHR